MVNIGIIRTASQLPLQEQTNEEVCANIPGLTSEWIIEKTGIKRRYHLWKSESSSEMAIKVAQRLVIGIHTNEIGLIIIASCTQEYMLPPLSVLIHSKVQAPKDCQVIDINTNCVGLITGTTMAVERMRVNPSIKYALVIGVEALSKYVDKTDKFTAPFFSDGASGVLLGRVPDLFGLIGSKFCTDSSVYEEVKLERGGYIYQNGKATWTQAITHLPYVLKAVVKEHGLRLSDIDFFIFHQANKVLIDYIMDKHQILHEKTYTNVEEIGNTGSASIGLALHDAVKDGLIKHGNFVVMAGIGAGFNFGANLWRWYEK